MFTVLLPRYPPAPFIDRTSVFLTICTRSHKLNHVFPPSSTLKDTILPLAFPITDVHGSELKEVFIPKDTVITIAIASMNRSVKVWGPDVMEWKPQRWLDGLPESVVSAQIPGIYSHLYVHSFYLTLLIDVDRMRLKALLGECRMTFSGGKRSCLGFKFSQLEMSKSSYRSYHVYLRRVPCLTEIPSLAEAVLCDLISTFRFSPSPKHSKVSFPMSTIVCPSIDGKPSLPLILEAVHSVD